MRFRRTRAEGLHCLVGVWTAALRPVHNRFVSSIIEFFVARDDAAAVSVAEIGPSGSFESATYGNFDVWSTLEEWESILTSRSIEELVTSDGPNVVVGGDGFPVVLTVSLDLTRALAAADDHMLSGAAERWVELRDEEGEIIDDELAQEIVKEVAALAVGAVRTGKSLYCWIC